MRETKEHILQQSEVANFSKLDDFSQLVKFRLNITVVLSSVLAYIVVAQSQASIISIVLLAVGGFCVTGAANALNQVLEKDFDKLMTRTALRPVANNRMTISQAVLTAGIMALIGITVLALFNPLAASLGMIALVSYAFIYTPLKRYSPIAVWVGAIPGALPVLIGTAAFEGTISQIALILFLVQFFWQLPHFWSIGWMSYDDYKRAGYKLLPVKNQIRDNRIGLFSFFWSLVLIPLTVWAYASGFVGMTGLSLLLFLNIGYSIRGWALYKKGDNTTAKKLMYYSFAYLPLALLLFILGSNVI